MKNRVENDAFRIGIQFSHWPSTLSFDLATASRRSSRVRGDPPGNPVQPARDRAAVTNRAGLKSEDQERRLEGILGIVRVVQ